MERINHSFLSWEVMKISSWELQMLEWWYLRLQSFRSALWRFLETFEFKSNKSGRQPTEGTETKGFFFFIRCLVLLQQRLCCLLVYWFQSAPLIYTDVLLGINNVFFTLWGILMAIYVQFDFFYLFFFIYFNFSSLNLSKIFCKHPVHHGQHLKRCTMASRG